MRRTFTMSRLLLRPRRRQNTVARAARYVGLAAWFGGSAMRVLAVEPAARTIDDPHVRAAFLGAIGKRGRAVALPAIVGHVAGSAALGWAGRHRGIYQRGMPTAMVLDTACTAAALTTAFTGGRFRRLEPLLTCGSLLAQGYLAEQQRPVPTLRRLRGLPRDGRPMRPSPVARAVQDAGLAAAFGGAVTARVVFAGAVDAPAPHRLATGAARARWWSIGVPAMAAHALGQLRLLQTNRPRLAVQEGAGTAMTLRAAAGAGAFVAALVAARLARRAARVDSADPDRAGVASARLRAAESAVVVLSAAALVTDAEAAEQQRPLNVATGV